MPLPRYPYTDFHEVNLDYILMMLRENSGLHLQMINNKLHLLNDLNESVSNVTITYAEKALTSMSGKELDLFIFSAGTSGNNLIFTDGEGNVTSLTVPFATKAEKDNLGQAITSYVKSVQVSGDKLRFNLGDGTNFELTVPFATKASTSETGKNIDTFAASLLVDGNELVLKDNLNNELSRITVAYSEKANKDSSGNVIISSYAGALQAGTTTVKLLAMDGSLLSEITVPYATAASNDNLGNSFLSSYAAKLVVNGNKIDLESMNDTVLSSITVPFATLATDATNAIESVSISGNNMIFTTYGGQSFSIVAPYAVSALKDGLQNEITETYVANITNDSQTGKITFYDAKGQVIVELIPTVDKATHDSYNNLIADFVKQISVDPNSNYITVTHGTGNTDSLVVNYSAHAWKDTNDHVIKNFYIADLECVEDVNDGHYKLVAYDGDTPKAELFRIEITAYSAQTDINGNDITDYLYNGSVSGSELTLVDGNGTSKVTYDPIPDDTGATSGDVLTTDGAGNLSWQTPVGIEDKMPYALNMTNDLVAGYTQNTQVIWLHNANNAGGVFVYLNYFTPPTGKPMCPLKWNNFNDNLDYTVPDSLFYALVNGAWIENNTRQMQLASIKNDLVNPSNSFTKGQNFAVQEEILSSNNVLQFIPVQQGKLINYMDSNFQSFFAIVYVGQLLVNTSDADIIATLGNLEVTINTNLFTELV